MLKIKRHYDIKVQFTDSTSLYTLCGKACKENIPEIAVTRVIPTPLCSYRNTNWHPHYCYIFTHTVHLLIRISDEQHKPKLRNYGHWNDASLHTLYAKLDLLVRTRERVHSTTHWASTALVSNSKMRYNIQHVLIFNMFYITVFAVDKLAHAPCWAFYTPFKKLYIRCGWQR